MSRDVIGSEIVVERRDIRDPVAGELIGELNAELTELYPEPGATHFRLDPDEVAEGQGAFLVAFRAGRPVGCGAVRRIEPGTGEIKRMYVRREERGRGISRVILAALEDQARALGLSRVVLETGTRQHEAIGLYERTGYTRIPPWGEYVDSSATSVCFAKEL